MKRVGRPSGLHPHKNTMRCAIYARVSTEDQHCEIQLTELKDYVKRCGWQADIQEYVEKLSGKEGVRRPQLERLLEAARLRKFDVVLVWKLDRFGRSVHDLSRQLQQLDAWGIRFISVSQGLDTDQRNPTSRLLLHILAAVAEFEREMIHDRTTTGFQAYRKLHATGQIGKTRHSKSGKDLPVGRPKKIFDRRKAAELRKAGKSFREIAKALGVSVGKIHEALKPA